MDSPGQKNPLLSFANCTKFASSWDKIQNKIPPGTKGNAYPKLDPPPYGITPFRLPQIPYEPKTSSITRSTWEGWRFGANFQGTDCKEKPYGYPDNQYYNQRYCGPCCPCTQGTNPPLHGDPAGKNPNIRYIQLDYKNLLGSGFASQCQPPCSQTSPLAFATACGKDHCTDCSGVYKKEKPEVKFQVCIGNPMKKETVQPCPVQPMKIYLPLQVIPKGGDGDSSQQFEVFVPGQDKAYNQQPRPECKTEQPKKTGKIKCGECDNCK